MIPNFFTNDTNRRVALGEEARPSKLRSEI